MHRRIVPVEPASGRRQLVVIEVQQHGAHQLDLRLVGCEGENPYVVQLQQSQLPTLKHNFKGTDAEWEAVLAHLLLQHPLAPDQANLLDRVRLVYTLNNDKLLLSICQHVHGIKLTWGEIVLPRNDEFELNPFEWAQASAQAHAQTLQELAEVKAHMDSDKHTITQLNAQLDDLIQSKNEAETAMLLHFKELLNEKKRKIRDQSRLLATAKVDKSTAQAMQSARTETPRKPAPSRTSKRKLVQMKTEEAKAESDSDQTEEARAASDSDHMEMEARAEQHNHDEDVPGPATPDRSDGETESEAEAPDSGCRGGSSETLKSTSTFPQPAQEAAPSQPSYGPPPPRALRFGRADMRSRGPARKPLTPPPADDDDDETDDEL